MYTATVDTAVELKEELRSFLQEASGIDDIDDDTELFGSGIVNSLFAIQMMMFMEKKWSLEIAPEDLNMDNFNTINAIADFIERKKTSL